MKKIVKKKFCGLLVEYIFFFYLFNNCKFHVFKGILKCSPVANVNLLFLA